MATRIVRIGLDGKLFYGAAGAQGATEMDTVKNVELVLEKDMADGSRRKSKGWKSNRGTLKNMKIEFDVPNASDDPHKSTVLQASLNDDLVALWARDHATGEGPDADFEVASWGRSEQLPDTQMIHVVCEVSDEKRTPTWS